MNDEDQATPPEQWALNVYNDTDRRRLRVYGIAFAGERKIPVVSLTIKRSGESAKKFGTAPIISHLTPDEADALATLLMYQAQLVREGKFQ